MNEVNQTSNVDQKQISWGEILVAIALIATILAGGYLRLVGVNWDDDLHMHPDERFLSMVQVAIAPVESFSAYFDTATSSLNPANRGYTFFVYGTLPIFIIRYIGEALGQTDYNSITILGRHISAIADLVTILLVFAIGRRLYNKWVGLLGAVFYAFAVLPIQLSHYMTVDIITNTFGFITVYAAVWAFTRQEPQSETNSFQPEPDGMPKSVEETQDKAIAPYDFARVGQLLRDMAPYILFGAALGAATASKINAVLLAMLLPLFEGMRFLKMGTKEREKALPLIIRNLLLAGFLSFLVFRIAQPYAFNGPGFFNIGINENWWSSLQSLRAQSSGEVDFPPALQWARRPITFSLENMVAWGLGWPLGITAWLSFFAMGWLIFRKQVWHRHLPLWVFTGLHFIWQSVSFTRSMRYQILIYPAMALIAGWGLVELCTVKNYFSLRQWVQVNSKTLRKLGVFLTLLVLVATAAWAYAFSRIYTQPHTRAAASEWVFQNIPGALTVQMQTFEGNFQQPLMYRAGDYLDPVESYRLPFYAAADGVLQSVNLPHILDTSQAASKKVVRLSILTAEVPKEVLASSHVESEFLSTENERRGDAFEFFLDKTVPVAIGDLFYIQLDLLEGDSELQIFGSPVLRIMQFDGGVLNQPLHRIMYSVRQQRPYSTNFRLVRSGTITGIHVPFLVDQAGGEGEKTLTLTLELPDQNRTSSVSIQSTFLPGEDIRGYPHTFELDEPLFVEADQVLGVTLSTDTVGAQLVGRAPVPVLESSWDDAIPYPVYGFGAYSDDGGIYRNDLNFQMYWPDDEQKLARFETNLDLADYIFISSNRQWGTTTRVPERYLLTTAYYRYLLGCPDDKAVEWCYRVAEPGMFEGSLGFELAATFQSYPNIGPIAFNTQFAEEAFSVYDHPKVIIFEKTDAYDPLAMRDLLRSVNLSKVVYFTPGEAARYRGPDPAQPDDPRYHLMLPEERLQEQREGGTWSDLFDRENVINISQPAAVILFYLFVAILGFLSYPLVRLALPGLPDRGYPLARLTGLMVLAFFVWILGSIGVAFTSTTILIVLSVMAIVAVLLVILQRDYLWVEIKNNWRYYLMVESLALIAFIFFLLIRLGNPDLWHPFKGGEKPMDFSYLNAVLKSTTFPPYDPWFAGGFINYYYYGFVIVGVPIKFLGIIPSIAYNLVLPLWYSILVLGAFSVGWNLYQGIPRSRALQAGETKTRIRNMALWVGLATAIGLAFLGNLGTMRLIISGFQRIAASGIPIEEAGIIQRVGWAIQGFAQYLSGTPMPFYPGDWYWVPSRVIPGEAITEFPMFTFIYADLHAHLIALPITVLAASWSLSVVLSKACWGERDGRIKLLSTSLSFFLGGVVIGALFPTNTWDFYTYLVLAIVVLFYSIIKHHCSKLNLKVQSGDLLEKVGVAVGASLLLVLLSLLFYYPFRYWFGQAYSEIAVWEGSRTPLNSYLTHWGLFLFVILSWMGWDTYHWMKTTPLSALKQFEPYLVWVYGGLLFFLLVFAALLTQGVVIALIAVPVGVWIVLLILRPGQSDGHRFLLFMVGTAVMLTIAVEVVHVRGDIGRMNTVFKFYLQAWILLALSAGVCLGWLIQSLGYWQKRIKGLWQVMLFVLLAIAALFTVTGTRDKIRDRMASDLPLTLDGMAYMMQANYHERGEIMDLAEDYHAIQWMQDQIVGSPVILEGQAYEYRWGNRFTINTGLPGVVGWNWHQRQQRAVLRSNVVQQRVDAVNEFYASEDLTFVIDFIHDHDVAYIVLGQLEKIFYDGPGLEKFHTYQGDLWDEVFRYGDTVIYRVLH